MQLKLALIRKIQKTEAQGVALNYNKKGLPAKFVEFPAF